MAGFICPVCGLPLKQEDKLLKCSEKHCYDISRRGYVNLLMSQKSGNHGDDKLMVRARRDFLDSGYYDSLKNKITETVIKYSHPDFVLLDAGCGECFYTSDMQKGLKEHNIPSKIFGIDISKNALSCAGERAKEINKAVASIFNIPLADASCDMIVNIFAPFCEEEFSRVLKKSGYYIQVIPLENHLWELKEIVYDTPYKNIVHDYYIDGYELVKCSEIRRKIKLASNDDIKNLFMMTPYYYKTSEKDFKKLDDKTNISVSTEFAVLTFRKK
ncbi:MAG: methyltransferase domain-containing protein [Ruminococcus sp.]|nr:methyltransferase domain-containing protein [Ruminococcus sp.]